MQYSIRPQKWHTSKSIGQNICTMMCFHVPRMWLVNHSIVTFRIRLILMYLWKFKACHFELNTGTSSSSSQPTAKKSRAGGLKKLIREVLSNSDDDSAPSTATTSVGDPSRPWRAEFTSYLETIEAAPPTGMSTIRWWGVSTVYATPKFLTDDSILSDPCTEIPGLGFPCTRLPLCYGRVSLEWASLPARRNYNQ